MKSKNLFTGIPSDLTEEFFTTLLEAEGLRIERIVSQGQASPPGFWCDQDEHEWVVVLEGSAVLEIEGTPEPVELLPGSYLNSPAHQKHRVVSTSPGEKTIWLAVHFR
ncbi:MAG: cupin domain-containing protein [Pirellulales bacterium]|nr:cupin domain-containing protein [Pirellulales bacterium]